MAVDRNALLKELTEASGVSGAEDEVRKLIVRELRHLVDDVSADPLGNVLARKMPKRPNGFAPRVMIAAHMDEVGLMITHVEDNGGLKFQSVGGIDARVLLSKTVRIGTDKIPGVIGSKPVHLLKEDEREKPSKIDDLTIDIGATGRKDAERYVKVGDYAGFDVPYGRLGHLVAAKALDDRVGCALLLDLIKDEFEFELHAVFTVQEEVGLRGAQVAAYSIRPDVAIVLETTVADDLPKDRDESPTTRLGGGPAITLMDKGMIADRWLVDLLISSAQADSIPYQIKQPLVGSTDAGAIQRVAEGTRTAVLAVPCRYLHSPTSTMDPNDFDNAARLIRQTLVRLPEWAATGYGATK